MQAGSLLVIIIALVIALGVFIPFILTIQNTLKSISLHNRKIAPGTAWILLIPAINIIWVFIMAKSLSESIESELKEREIPTKSKPTLGYGITWGILYFVTIIAKPDRNEPPSVIYILSWLAWLTFFIIYWAEVAKYKKIMQRPQVYAAATGESEIQ